jgi:TonB family protein
LAEATEPENAPAAEPIVLDSPPVLKVFIHAEYPPQQLKTGAEGTVILRFLVNERGQVENIEILGSAGAEFDAAARAAVAKFEFIPARYQKEPVPVTITYRYQFTLTSEERAAIDKATKAEQARQDEARRQAEIIRKSREQPNFKGYLIERGTRNPLAGLTLYCNQDGERQATTDAAGYFQTYLEPGSYTIKIPGFNHNDFETTETIRADAVTTVKYYLERKSYNEYQTVVKGKREKKEVSYGAIDSVEIDRIPGTSGDAIKVVQTLPGIARAPFQGGLIVIRGSAPEDSLITLNDQPIPLPFHFGGLKSTFNSTLLKSLDFYAGGFGAKYGRVTGGIVNIEARDPRTDRFHGYADLSVFDFSLLGEGPITKKTSFAAAFRRSHIDFILPLVLPDSKSFDLTVAPRYYDYQFILTSELTPRHKLTFTAYGSLDKLEFLLNEPVAENPDLRGDFYFRTMFYRFDVALHSNITPDIKNRASLTSGFNQLRFDAGEDLFFNLDVYPFLLRDDLSWTINPFVRLNLGLDTISAFGKVAAFLPPVPKEGEPEVSGGSDEYTELSSKFTINDPAIYLETIIDPTKELSLVPGVRLDFYSYIAEYSVAPRFSIRYALSTTTTLKGATGLYYQEPQPDEESEEFGNPDIKLERAIHYVAGVEQKFGELFNLDFQLYYKDLDSLVVRSEQIKADGTLENYNNAGIGRIYGADFLFKREISEKFFGWISYSLLRSERKDGPGQPYRAFDFDQTHVLSVVASYILPRWNVDIGLRYALSSGNPYTPFSSSIFDADSDVYYPVPGTTNSERMPLYHQLDLRIDKKFVFKTFILSTYLDLYNAYNHRNVEDIQYNYDYSQKKYVTGLPIIPSFGIKGEF